MALTAAERQASYRARHPDRPKWSVYNREGYLTWRRAYYQKNRNKILKAASSYNQRNKELVAARNKRRWLACKNDPERLRRKQECARAWARGNWDKVSASLRKYAERNKDKILLWRRLREARRRTRKMRNGGDCTAVKWLARVEYYGWRCFYCKLALTEENITLDHRIPVMRGGPNWPANLVPACQRCNSMKGARLHWLCAA